MKKLLAIAIALALVLSLSVTAMADDNVFSPEETLPAKDTEVTFSVAPTYTVTIPAKIELTPNTVDGTTTYKQDASISATNVRLEAGYGLNVTLLASDFQLTTTDGTTLNYEVTVGNNTDPITDNDDTIVATFITQTDAQSVTLHFSADDPTYAGTYTGTVTFTLSVVEIRTT